MKKANILFLLIVFNISVFGQSVPSYIPANGLVGWYPFTGNANDMSGSGNNGIVVGASLTTDRFGNNNEAYYFNGTTNHISIPNNFFDIGWNGYTISCWLNTSHLTNPNNNNLTQVVYCSRPFEGIALDFNWGGTVNKYGVFAGSNPPSDGWNVLGNVSSNSNVTTNTWNNLILTKSGNIFSLYINGVLDSTFTGATTVSSHLSQMVIGSTDSTSVVETFFGNLDDFGFWNRALSIREINQVYQSNSTASIKSINNTKQLNIYPNPASNVLNIGFEKLSQKSEIKISNVIVAEVRKEVIENNEESIQMDISNLANGIYFVTLSSGEESFTKKIVINK